MRLISILILVGIWQMSFGQKPILDTSCLNTWPEVGNGKISNNGKYVSYSISFNDLSLNTLIVKTQNGSWERQLRQINNIEFSNDSKLAIYKVNTINKVGIIRLGTDYTEFIDSIKAYNLTEHKLVYLEDSYSPKLHIRELSNEKELVIDNVKNYVLGSRKIELILTRQLPNDSVRIEIYNLKTNKSKILWEGLSLKNILFDETNHKIAFSTEVNKKLIIWYYESSFKQAQLLLDSNISKLGENIIISGLRAFSQDGNGLFFTIQNNQHSANSIRKKINPIQLEIWGYNDWELITNNTPYSGISKNYLSFINLRDKSLIKIEDDTSKLFNHGNEFGIIEVRCSQTQPKFDWMEKFKSNYYFLDFHTGKKEHLDYKTPMLSDLGKYLLYFDLSDHNLYLRDIKTGQRNKITNQLLQSSILKPYYDDYIRVNPLPMIETRWLDNDNILLIHDQFDIWQIDPTGIKEPINLTNSYGSKNKIRFDLFRNRNLELKNGDKVMISAFNRLNKENGFYEITLGKSADPKKLVMAPYLFYSPYEISDNGEFPLKAEDCNLWLIKRMDADEFPNYFVTTDFAHFIPISNIHPEHSYNWLKTELYDFSDDNGKNVQGILYKPEDFNPNHKYPIIFYYYEKLSNNLHVFQPPSASNGPINIPWFVSHGYLVFTPDIHYKIGHPGESALNSVINAAKTMSKKPFVDSTKMAIQGHSFGGFETNYIVSHTNVFSAACSAAGVSDMVSEFGTVNRDGFLSQESVEVGQYRLGVSLWEDPKAYIENSAVFQLNNVNTPLLIVHTSDDVAVNLSQAVELFTGLRRLKKKAWLIIYHNENHIIWNRLAAIDYTIRVEQFFDYYLKNKKPPIWMTEGIPQKLTGVTECIEIDNSNKIP